jgi:hypothetical protein
MSPPSLPPRNAITVPTEATRLALYAAVNEQIKSYRSQQWTFAILILTLLYGIGTFCESHKTVVATLLNKSVATAVLLAVAITGSIHLARLQKFVETHKRARHLLERSFGFKEWPELTELFSLLGSKKIRFAGDSFEVALWIFSFVLFTAGSAYTVWCL